MPNTPIIVGVAQNEQRITDWQQHKEPLELMFDALQSAAGDSGNPKILEAASAIRVIRGRWPYTCLLYTSPSPRDQRGSRMPSSA